MRRNLHPLTVAEEDTFLHILLSYDKIYVSTAIRLTKAYLAERGMFSPSTRETIERFAHNWKKRNNVRKVA